MRYLKLLSTVVMAAALVGCGSDSTPAVDAPPTGGFTQPAGTVAVNFVADDTANQVYEAGDLEWKGSMIYDPVTRKVTLDTTWGGPWAVLYDDGPWNVDATPGNPGHEPIGQTAGDNKWGVTVFVTPPATGSVTYEYGLIDRDYETNFGNGWVWIGSNGTYAVAAGATTAITASGLTFPAFGTTDFELSVDTDLLDTSTAWDTSTVRLKGSAWAWSNRTLTPDANHVATFTLSAVVGAGKPFPHTGLLKSGDKPEFIFVFGPGDGVEYKAASGDALATGVTARVKPSGGSFTPVTIEVNATNHNTFIEVP